MFVMPSIKSKESIDEINAKAQERLSHRRDTNKQENVYLYGAPKIKLPPYKTVVHTRAMDLSPRFIYYKYR